MKPSLEVYAGERAMRSLRTRGLRPHDVDVVCGASGGPKWIVLYGLDRVLLQEFFTGPRSKPLHLIGSSSGAWRMACYAQQNPTAALDRLAAAYIGQRYPPNPPLDLVSETCAAVVRSSLGETGADEILSHPWARLHVLTACCRGLLASDSKPLLLAGLVIASVCNLVRRSTLGWWMTRVIFHTAGSSSPFLALRDLPTRHVTLSTDNLHGALLASGSIPMLARGVQIADAPEGRYRDGALTDYHPDLDFGPGEGLVLYPHFFPRIVPGWLDKCVPWSRPNSSHLDRAVVLVPSRDFVSRLPRGKIPDRNDFRQCGDALRMRDWTTVREASGELGEEFRELLASGRIADRVRPLPFRTL